MPGCPLDESLSRRFLRSASRWLLPRSLSRRLFPDAPSPTSSDSAIDLKITCDTTPECPASSPANEDGTWNGGYWFARQDYVFEEPPKEEPICHAEVDAVNSRDNLRIFQVLAKSRSCFFVVPRNPRIIYFELETNYLQAWWDLVRWQECTAPVIDSAAMKFACLLTTTDFAMVVVDSYDRDPTGASLRRLTELSIGEWMERARALGAPQNVELIAASDSVYNAAQRLLHHRIHCIPVVDNGRAVCFLTPWRILKFLSTDLPCLPKKKSWIDQTPRSLGIGSWGVVLALTSDASLIEVIKKMIAFNISALPIVFDSGKIGLYTKENLRIYAGAKFNDFEWNISMNEIAQKYPWQLKKVHTARCTTTVRELVTRALKSEDVRRFFVCNKKRAAIGVVSITDILRLLILNPPPPAEGYEEEVRPKVKFTIG